GRDSGTVFGASWDLPNLKIARYHVSQIEDGCSLLDFHFMVARPGEIQTWRERHKLGLFSRRQYEEAFHAAELELSYVAFGPSFLGSFVGYNPRQT
ncbi:MAG: hypothetical protein GYB68_15635, partial [Chloroflexi bacterium]|nr:hypothetical protein [Chloroflexota bacterium]